MGWFKRKKEEAAEEEQRMVLHAAQLHGVAEGDVVDAVLDRDDEFEDEELEERGRRGHAGVWVTLAVVVLLFGAGVVVMMKIANGADQSGPTADSGVQAMKQSIAPTPAALPSLTGAYVSFSYPQVFDAVATLANWPTTAERYSIGSKDDYQRSIQVMVEKDTATPEDDSGFKFRQNSPDQYHAEPVKVGAEPAVVMVKNDNTEQTLYWAHAGMLVVVSVTSTTGSDDLSSFVNVIRSSLKWVAA
jgi:hypothetical protein